MRPTGKFADENSNTRTFAAYCCVDRGHNVRCPRKGLRAGMENFTSKPIPPDAINLVLRRWTEPNSLDKAVPVAESAR
jgi:hypothetical protein